MTIRWAQTVTLHILYTMSLLLISLLLQALSSHKIRLYFKIQKTRIILKQPYDKVLFYKLAKMNTFKIYWFCKLIDFNFKQYSYCQVAIKTFFSKAVIHQSKILVKFLEDIRIKVKILIAL